MRESYGRGNSTLLPSTFISLSDENGHSTDGQFDTVGETSYGMDAHK